MDSEKVFITITMPNESEPNTSMQSGFTMSAAPMKTEDPPNNMCRLCATITDFVVPIFADDGLRNGLADKIHQHLPIQVSPSDTLPLVVCYQCASTLLAWHELVQCCVQADQAMRVRYAMAASPTEAEHPKNQAITCDQSQEIVENIKTVLSSYFHSLNMEEYSAQVDLVCQMCDNKPALNGDNFCDHLLSEHTNVTNKDDINAFVRDNVTFVEALSVESEVHSETEQTEPETPARRPLPTLLCPHCDSAFSSSTRLLSHLNAHMELSIEDGVECCDVKYTSKREYATHLQERHVNRLVYDTEAMCKSCGFDADTPELLRAHVAEKHKRRERNKAKESPRNQKSIPAVCPECNVTFSNKYNMLFHLKSHEGGESHACDKCGKSYTTRGNLAQHRRAAHEGALRHVCAACGEAFPSGAARDNHARLHTGDRPHRCRLCDKRFRAKNTLDNHLRMHLDVRPHACAACARTFRKRSHLTAHARTHRR